MKALLQKFHLESCIYVILYVHCKVHIALSAQCGILTTMSTGGNIFKFEDNVCSIGEYFGAPEDYADGGVRTWIQFLL